MSKNRFFLEYAGNAIELMPGETIVGRHIECRIRFNDAAVSRRHVRFALSDEQLLIEDLGSKNGTTVNGNKLSGATCLADGDLIGVGNRWLRLRISSDTETPDTEDQTESRVEWISPPLPRERQSTESRVAAAVSWASKATLPEQHTCPKCRQEVPIEESICHSCGYEWPKGRPLVSTQRLEVRATERRQHPRVKVDIPVFYASELLNFEAETRDISRGGVFLATDLLDRVETSCKVTLLPDADQAMSFDGVVRRLVTSKGSSMERPPGMGIELVNLSARDLEWIDRLIGRNKGPDD